MSGARVVPVLCYHGVGPRTVAELAPWQISLSCFDEQLSHLRDAGYETVPLALLASWLTAPDTVTMPERPVVITFDDAYAAFADAVDVLARHEAPATLFVPTAHVGEHTSWYTSVPARRERVMSWEALADVQGEGIEIGSHAHRHLRLDEQPRAVTRNEVALSKQLLEDKLGLPVRGFAYPYGCHDRVVMRIVEELGFSYACAVRNMLSGTGDDVFAIARIFPPCDDAGSRFARIVAEGERSRHVGEQFRTKAWRAVRRIRARVAARP